MDDEKIRRTGKGRAQKAQQFISVGMSAQSMDRPDLTLQVVPPIIDSNAWLANLNTPAQRLRRNPSTKNDQVVRILDALREMVQHPAEFARWAGGDNHAR